jgi:peptide/nickel transport system substrate-binding protein
MNKKLTFIIFCLLFLAGSIGPVMAEDKILKIATTDEVKSQAFMTDYNINQMNMVSNPPLTQFDENGKITGALADSYKVSSDNTIWIFTLKANQFWSDGKPVTPEDVQYTMQMMGKNDPNYAWIPKFIKDITVDGNKITYTLHEPYTNLHQDLGGVKTLPKHKWESVEKPMEYTGDGGSYVGCGPFFIDAVDLNAGTLTFKKNPFWKGKAPYYDAVIVSWFKNEDAASKSLENGEMDTYWKYSGSYPFANIESLQSTGTFDILEKPSTGVTFLGFNLNKEPMSDLAFREAISKALNYQELVDISTLGHGRVPNTGFIPPAMNGYVETDQLQYNPDDAKKILENAGYKDSDGNGIIEGNDGKDLKLDFLIRDSFSREAELVKDYLEKVGFGVEIHSVDQNTWMDLKDKFDYDITLTRTTPFGMIKQAGWATAYFDSRLGGGGLIKTVSDPAFHDICDGILSTTDRTKLAGYAKEVQQYYADNLPGIPLYWKNDVTPYDKAITGWYSNPMFGIMNEFTFSGVKPVA